MHCTEETSFSLCNFLNNGNEPSVDEASAWLWPIQYYLLCSS